MLSPCDEKETRVPTCPNGWGILKKKEISRETREERRKNDQTARYK